MRSTRKDGLTNQLEFYLTTNFPRVWRLVQAVAPIRRLANRTLINRAVLKMPTRPNPFSTLASYSSWRSLTDRSFDGRHLPPAQPMPLLPDVEDVVKLFERGDEMRTCPKSTVLFPYFAQWFTDGFLRSDRSEPRDPRRNESNHEIDLMQLYGLTPAHTRQLRTFESGRLKSQVINGEEYPPYLCENGRVKPEFSRLSVVRFDQLTDEQKNTLFAMGSDTSNFQLGFVLMNVLFLREHNRVAGIIARHYPSWTDERIFGTTRNIMIVLLIKIVIEEYINHIAPYHFKFRADPRGFDRRPWYRTNWMAIEFNLLYRWHSAVPSSLHIDGTDVPVSDTLWPSALVTDRGIGPHFEDASHQSAAEIGLYNTDELLLETERASLQQARTVRLASYNDYREHCGYPRVTAFDQISGDPRIQQGLSAVYGHVDRIEFYVGLFAEDRRPNSVLPALMGRMVGIDAFSQAFTNPLLATRIFNRRTFSPVGWDVIAGTERLADLVQRNVPAGSPTYHVSMSRTD